ncbi:NAD(P)-dependent alcohol dehydrogenase [Yoonia sp. R2331]|uniref:NAD(P)-dependent alcohol dehydrogenase n=1 Tax=Yoonia sp. R2331 TaxID=3237238 RepID=UPI0034E47433
MLAYSYTQYGPADVVSKVEVPTPTAKPNEVLIRIVATTVSAGDWRARSLTMPKGLGLVGRLVFGITGPRKPILGTELSGIIEKVGTDVSTFQPGDAVIGFPGAGFGAHAEFIAMPADGKLVRKPDSLSFAESAAIPFGATTAYDFLVNKAKVQAGDRILINGASGSVGSASVQIAKHLGAEVTAVCSAKNAGLMRKLGADRVIDYRNEDIVENGVQYDIVVDTVGTLPWSQAQQAIRHGGKMVLIAGKTSDMFFGAIKAALKGKKMIGGVATESREVLQAVVNLAAQGALLPVIDRRYSFDDMRVAHAHVDTGRKKGNVVVTVKSDESERSRGEGKNLASEVVHA